MVILKSSHRFDNGRLDIPVYFSSCGKDAASVTVSKKQMGGFGGVVSFEIAPVPGEEPLSSTSRFIDAMTIPYIAPSLGGVESLIEQPALMSYYEFSTQERLEIGISDNLVRFALGIEDTSDILADLNQALAQV